MGTLDIGWESIDRRSKEAVLEGQLKVVVVDVMLGLEAKLIKKILTKDPDAKTEEMFGLDRED